MGARDNDVSRDRASTDQDFGEDGFYVWRVFRWPGMRCGECERTLFLCLNGFR